MSLNRRSFLGTGLALGAALSAPCAIGQARPRVVALGGGAGGATAARYIAKDSDGAIEVVLIEPGKTYYTCFFSNLYLGGFRDFSSIAHDYGTLASRYGINVIHDLAVDIDRAARSVTLASGHALGYDRLIVAPGIDFVDGAVPGWDMTVQNRMPHAWKAGSQTQLLKAQIGAMRAGGVFCMVAPPDPFRCPPGPYERVSMVAHVLKESNPTAKILIVDPKENFSKQALFEDGWARHYPGMIQRIGPDFGGANVEVRPDSMEVVIDGMAETVDVCNVIPAQKAGHIAGVAGLADDSGFCPILPGTMQSRFDENVYVLGDATIAGDMPKSAFSANSQAKVAAMQVRAALTRARAFPAKYSNTCWSLIDSGDGVKVGASYQVGEDRIAKVDGFVSQIGEDAALRKATYEESLGWYAGITADIFG
ncbi:sulfur oxidation F protein [Rhodovulum sulfidophilum]|uniref:Sulfur oxidation F protein n=1 Tax=Rhodovulum sulfidophilum TaxID=35806 RepID=A0A0D6B4S7_RHOSU|nr:sulfur oxidation F protein [Rhodovulum sulfidophilum]